MKSRSHMLFAALVCTVLLFLGLIFHRRLSLSAGEGMLESPTATTPTTLSNDSPENTLESRPTPVPADKVIVMAKLQREETDWVAKELPDWQNAIYVVDNTSAPLHTSINKGSEANAYLLYIIEHYEKLPSTIAFLHAHRAGWPEAWHNDVPNYDNVVAMNTLQIGFVQQSGYVNLRCNWNPGCPDEVQYLRSVDDVDPENVEHQVPFLWHHFFGKDSVVPEVLATPCCAQFAVSKEQVLRRPLEDYQKFYQWLLDTPLTDGISGRLFEYLWHVIFGKDAV